MIVEIQGKELTMTFVKNAGKNRREEEKCVRRPEQCKAKVEIEKSQGLAGITNTRRGELLPYPPRGQESLSLLLPFLFSDDTTEHNKEKQVERHTKIRGFSKDFWIERQKKETGLSRNAL